MAPSPASSPQDPLKTGFWRKLRERGFEVIVTLCTLGLILFIVWMETRPHHEMWGFDRVHVRWLLLLAMTIVLSETSVLVPNFLVQADKGRRRPHNHVRVLNEMLAIHQLGYVSFYFAIVTGMYKGLDPGEISVMLLAIVLSLLFYFIASKFVADQDQNLGATHLCKDEARNRTLIHPCVDPSCCESLSWPLKKKVLGLNAVLSLFEFLFAFIFAVSPIVVPK
jgi:hypothetical protein